MSHRTDTTVEFRNNGHNPVEIVNIVFLNNYNRLFCCVVAAAAAAAICTYMTATLIPALHLVVPHIAQQGHNNTEM